MASRFYFSQGPSPAANKAKAKSLTSQSFLLELQGLQSAKDALLKTAQINVGKLQKELELTLEDAAKKFNSVSATQRAQAGASGLSIYSQSFLDVYAETANQYTTQVRRLKDVTASNQQALMQDSMLKAEEYVRSMQSVQLEAEINKLMN